LPKAPGIVCGRGYEVGVIFLFSSKNEIVVTVSEIFESGPVESRMCVFQILSARRTVELKNLSGCKPRIRLGGTF